jgi:DNA invertase Pin-like site-specific DNA recombinase
MGRMPRVYSYIRMSSAEQEWGDSIRRQDEAAQAYAKAKGWELLEQDQLRDKGLSAFTGKHLAGGALGRFLAAIREGKIEPGSVLLVESLDRLSRQESVKALGTFTEILNAGVTVVTLADGRTYTSGTDSGDLIVSIVDMSRAHNESKMKSQRGKATWANKRKNATTRILTAKCPGWLRVSKDRKRFEVIRKRANIVRSIYRDSVAGLGIYAIMTRLNRARVPVFGRSKGGWHHSTVNEILTNRATLGEFQPCHVVNGRREPEGPVLKNYYPKIVDEELFYRAQAAREQRKGKPGRKGKHFNNLFSGLARCAYCSSPMLFINKGNGPYGGQSLLCDAARRGLGCKKTGWRYRDFESSFLAFVLEVDLNSVLRADVGADLDAEIDALRGERASIRTREDRLLQLYENSPDEAPESVRQRLDGYEQQRVKLEAKIRAKEQARANVRAEARQVHEIKADIERLQNSKGEGVYELRAKVAARLRTIVLGIWLAPAGAPEDRRRFFTVAFRDKWVRQVYPSDDDPLSFKEQLLGTEEDGFWRYIYEDRSASR